MGCAAEEKFVGWERNKGCENDRCCWNSIIPWFDIVTKRNKCCNQVRPNAAQDMQTQSRSIHDQIKRLDKIVTCYTLLEKIPKFLIFFLNQISICFPHFVIGLLSYLCWTYLSILHAPYLNPWCVIASGYKWPWFIFVYSRWSTILNTIIVTMRIVLLISIYLRRYSPWAEVESDEPTSRNSLLYRPICWACFIPVHLESNVR
jgi:hypothetical protein